MAIAKIILNGVVQMDVTGDTVASGNLLSGYTATGADGQSVSGGITSQGATTYNVSSSDQTISAGKYLTGAQTIRGVTVSDTLVAANIKDGVTVKIGDAADDDRILSVTGTLSGGGGGLVYETGTYTPSEDTVTPVITFTNTHAESPIFVMISDTGVYDSTSDTSASFVFADWYRFTGTGVYPSPVTTNYAVRIARYRSANTTAFSSGTTQFTNSSDDTGSSTAYPSYYVTNTQFQPQTASGVYYRSGRTYKWIAVWKPTA